MESKLGRICDTHLTANVLLRESRATLGKTGGLFTLGGEEWMKAMEGTGRKK